jgi:hypothetical protein
MCWCLFSAVCYMTLPALKLQQLFPESCTAPWCVLQCMPAGHLWASPDFLQTTALLLTVLVSLWWSSNGLPQAPGAVPSIQELHVPVAVLAPGLGLCTTTHAWCVLVQHKPFVLLDNHLLARRAAISRRKCPCWHPLQSTVPAALLPQDPHTTQRRASPAGKIALYIL